MDFRISTCPTGYPAFAFWFFDFQVCLTGYPAKKKKKKIRNLSHRLPGFHISYPAFKFKTWNFEFSPAPLITQLLNLDFSIFQVCRTGYLPFEKEIWKFENLPHRLPGIHIGYQTFTSTTRLSNLKQILKFSAHRFFRYAPLAIQLSKKKKLEICPTGYPAFTSATRLSNSIRSFTCPTGYPAFAFRVFRYAHWLPSFEKKEGIYISYPAFKFKTDSRIFSDHTRYRVFAFWFSGMPHWLPGFPKKKKNFENLPHFTSATRLSHQLLGF